MYVYIYTYIHTHTAWPIFTHMPRIEWKQNNASRRARNLIGALSRITPRHAHKQTHTHARTGRKSSDGQKKRI